MPCGRYRFNYAPMSTFSSNANKAIDFGMALINDIASKITSVTDNAKTVANNTVTGTTFATALTNGIIPSWVNTIGTASSSYYVIGCIDLTISTNQTAMKMAIVVQYDSSPNVRTYLYMSDGALSKYYEVFSMSVYTDPSFWVDYSICEKLNEYFLIKYIGGSYTPTIINSYWFGYLHFDQPIAISDTQNFVRICGNTNSDNRYVSKFSTEDIASTQVYLTVERSIPEGYSTLTNGYNGKIPLYPVWCGTGSYGLRGKSSHLIALSKAYNNLLSYYQIYTIDTVQYFSLVGIGYDAGVNTYGSINNGTSGDSYGTSNTILIKV